MSMCEERSALHLTICSSKSLSHLLGSEEKGSSLESTDLRSFEAKASLRQIQPYSLTYSQRTLEDELRRLKRAVHTRRDARSVESRR